MTTLPAPKRFPPTTAFLNAALAAQRWLLSDFEYSSGFVEGKPDIATAVLQTPPMLGVFSDIPWHKLRESEVMAWAKAGFSWVVCDGEHSLQEGR